MSTTLPFGLVRPDTGDKGAAVFTPLESNITQLDQHKHNGVDSDRVDGFNQTRATVNVTAAAWSADGEFFKKTVTFPAGYSTANGSDYGNAVISFYFDGGTYDGEQLFPKTVKLSASTFELHSISNSQAYNVSFL